MARRPKRHAKKKFLQPTIYSHIIYDRGLQQEEYYSNLSIQNKYEGWNFNSGNYLFTTDTK